MTDSWLRDNCPRLYKAHQERLAILRAYQQLPPAMIKLREGMEALSNTGIKASEAMKQLQRAFEK